MDKFRSMEVFVAVAEAGSFTGAARALDLSTVMVSKHIAQLEHAIGARLIQRTTRRQSLTEIGEHYVEQCRQILAQVRAAEAGAEAMRSAPRGTLKLSAPAAFGAECLAPAMGDFLAAHPEVNVELELSNRIADLVEEGLDAAIRIGRLDDSSLVARPLQPYGMTICAAPSYLARRGTPRTPADLAQHDCLDLFHWNRHLRWHLDPSAAKPTLPASRFRSNNGQAIKQAAVAGVGIVMLAGIVLHDEVARGRLVPLLQDYLPPPRPLHLVYPRHMRSTPKHACFVEFVVERFGLR